ncbi:hypothetical protein RRG08_061204 [Elysia crispata]|uniref:Uncharacterized protein n=1 Tax=Elysia crispata TaxID=231223 RepID=A0AAE0ZMV8_9GAST|nr:hypothetical protein RRG08_061204 [Elysia crispata]
MFWLVIQSPAGNVLSDDIRQDTDISMPQILNPRTCGPGQATYPRAITVQTRAKGPGVPDLRNPPGDVQSRSIWLAMYRSQERAWGKRGWGKVVQGH